MCCFASALACLATATIGFAQPVVVGQFRTTGVGCPFAPGNFIYELFPAGVFDLDNSAIEWIPNGSGGYIVVPSVLAPLPFGAASATAFDVVAADDTVGGPHNLTFAFPYVGGGGSTTRIWIAPNGHVYFDASTDSRCCSGNAARTAALATTASAAMSIFGNDLNASTTSTTGQGQIWMDEQSVGGQRVAVITWDNVGEFGVTVPGASHNCQMLLWEDGRVTFQWFGMSTTTDATFVGYSPGGGAVIDVGPSDFSSLPIDGGTGAQVGPPFTILMASVPVENSPIVVDFHYGSATATAGALLLGAGSLAAPLDLIGMPGCSLLTTADIGAVPAVLTASGGTVMVGTVPSGNAGLTIHTQGALIDLGVNALGVVTSNRGSIVIGSDAGSLSGIVVQLEGTNTFFTTAQPPFWSVFNNSTTGELIQSVRFDLAGSSDPTIATTAFFDTDGNSALVMGDFRAGDSALRAATCTDGNSFRGTDVATGLVYPGTGVSACDATATTGHILTNPGGVSLFQTVDFAFSSFGVGDAFQFDVDVDGGPLGANGLHRIVVTVTTDQRTVSGELVVVGAATAVQAF